MAQLTLTPSAAFKGHRRPSSVLERLALAVAIARSRRQLAKLDASALSDIGISEAQAIEEAARPFWDAPAHWHG